MSLLYCFMHKFYIKALINDAVAQNKNVLELASTDLDEIPDELFRCADLRKIFLGQNKISTIGPDVRHWRNLTVLSLDYNRIETLPDEIGELKTLVYLNVSHNPLKGLPEIIGSLDGLETLWCNDIQMDALPDRICDLANLQTLGARKNNIRFLPKNFTKLTKLSWLTLQSNMLEELPEGLGDLELIHLNVSINCLRELPGDMTGYKHMQYFIANHNQISCLPLLESTKWDLSGMISLVYIDLRDNPIEDDRYFKDYFQSYPQLKSSTQDLFETGENNIENQTQPMNRANGDIANNNNVENNEAQEDDDSDSSSYEDWEHSISSSQLNYEEQSDDDLEGNEIRGIDIPIVSRFAGTGS